MARFPASGARQFSEEPQIWDNLNNIAAGSGFNAGARAPACG